MRLCSLKSLIDLLHLLDGKIRPGLRPELLLCKIAQDRMAVLTRRGSGEFEFLSSRVSQPVHLELVDRGKFLCCGHFCSLGMAIGLMGLRTSPLVASVGCACGSAKRSDGRIFGALALDPLETGSIGPPYFIRDAVLGLGVNLIGGISSGISGEKPDDDQPVGGLDPEGIPPPRSPGVYFIRAAVAGFGVNGSGVGPNLA